MPSVQSQPQSRGGNKVRIPLDHPETDAIAKRICILLCMDVINDDERGHLIKKYGDLRPLPPTELRPMFFDDYLRPLSGMNGKPAILVMAGWVHRLRDYVGRLERKYFDAANDDI